MKQTKEKEATIQAQQSLNYIVAYLKKESLYTSPILFRIEDIQELLNILIKKGA